MGSKGNKILIKNYSDYKDLFNRYYVELCTFALTVVNSETVAEDVVQDFFVKLWEQRKTTTVNSSEKGFMFSSIKNSCISYLRSNNYDKRYVQIQAESASYDLASGGMEFMDLKSAYNVCLERLPDRCRQIFELGRIDNLKQSKISDLLSISINTVKVQMGRALSFLRDCVSKKAELTLK